MAEYVLCPFFRKEYDEYILCEMCETYFPSPVKKKRKMEEHCCRGWEACNNAMEMMSIYEMEGEMFELKKLKYMLKNRSTEVYQMKIFMSKKDKKIQELLNQMATKESYVKRANDRITMAEKQIKMQKAQLDAQERVMGYMAHKYKIGKINLAAVKKFGEHFYVKFQFSSDIGLAIAGKRKLEDRDNIIIVVSEKEISDADKGFTGEISNTSESQNGPEIPRASRNKPDPKVS